MNESPSIFSFLSRLFGWELFGDCPDCVYSGDGDAPNCPVVVHTMEFPTEIIEEGFTRAQIESVNGDYRARITWPRRSIEEEALIRLEQKALSLWRLRDTP